MATRTLTRKQDLPGASPIGDDHEHTVRLRSRNPAYQEASNALAPFEGLARIFIAYRIAQGLTQEQLADRMKTSASAISRIESGAHQPGLPTLRRFAAISGRRLLVGYEDEAGVRELVAV